VISHSLRDTKNAGVKSCKRFLLTKSLCEKFNKFVQRQRYQMAGMKGEKKWDLEI
jgi:hypothetical protein